VRFALASTLVFASVFAVAGTAAADEDPDGIGIAVQVLGPDAGTPTHNGGSGGGSTPEPTPSSSAPPPPLGNDPFDLGGVLYISGLQGSITPQIASTGGRASLRVIVRNVSDYLVDVKLRFWLQNVFGQTVAEVKGLHAADILPGETRVISVSLANLGQWSVYNAHVTITPPKKVGGVALSPVTRDATLFVPPFFAAISLLVIGILYFGIRYLLVLWRQPAIGAPA
jgi:hypothetical protein